MKRLVLFVLLIFLAGQSFSQKLDAQVRNLRVRDSVIVGYDVPSQKYVLPLARGAASRLMGMAASGNMVAWHKLDSLVMNDSTLLSQLITYISSDSALIAQLISSITNDSAFLNSLITALTNDSIFMSELISQIASDLYVSTDPGYDKRFCFYVNSG
jgi:hypothetical protein